jgi:DNA-binding CsgD family transcriptional regulator
VSAASMDDRSNQPSYSPHPTLTQPLGFLQSLVDSFEDEFAFYSQDMEGRFVYLSRSSESVFRRPANSWKVPFHETLTDAPCNEALRSRISETEVEAKARRRTCEIYDPYGNRLALEIWRAPVIQNGVKVGLAGMARRLDHPASSEFATRPNREESASSTGELTETPDDAILMSKVEGLSDVERQVIEFAVDGLMNKRMASMLDVAVRTIESRRARAMSKLEIKALPQLIKVWMRVRLIEAERKKSTGT